MNSPHWLDNLRARGLFAQSTDEQALRSLERGTACYIGVDPTGPSLQLGNLVPLIVAIHLAQAGLKPIILFGGATGAIGDPSGKSSERKLLSKEQISLHAAKMATQTREIFQRLDLGISFVNNADWTDSLSVIDFLRDIGKHFPVAYMLGKEFVRQRVEGEGITYTEFSYMLLQAMDFLHLYEHHDVRMQFGGNDQWGNITAGLELIRRKGLGPAYAFCVPLLTKSDGSKFGKSEEGSIWLDGEATSAYELHQFFLNQEDERMSTLLPIFSLSNIDDLQGILLDHNKDPSRRTAQRFLADEVVRLVHGEEALKSATHSAGTLFNSKLQLETLSDAELLALGSEVPNFSLDSQALEHSLVADLFVLSKLCASKGEAKRLIQSGGAYLFSTRVEDVQQTVPENFRKRQALLLRAGKKKYALLAIR